MQRGRLVFGATCGAIVLAIAAGEGCRDATQVVLEIDTKLTCNELRGIEIIVGSEPYGVEERAKTRFSAASTTQCTPKPGGGSHVGTLVLTPSGSRAAVLVIAGVTAPASACVPPLYAGCVVARRSFGFIDHVSLTLPVLLDPVCLDVPCTAVSTCSNKQCVKSEVACSESRGCDREPSASRPDDFVDAGPLDPDGSAGDGATDAAADAPVDAPTDAPIDAQPVGTCPNPPSCQSMGMAQMCSISSGEQTCCALSATTAACQDRTAACATEFRACCDSRSTCLMTGRECCASTAVKAAGSEISCGTPQECMQGGDTFICFAPTGGAMSPDCPNAKACTTTIYAMMGTKTLYKCAN